VKNFPLRWGAMAGPVLLRACGLSKSYPGVRALSDVTLEIRAGQVHALVGENGAGKSTLARVLSGMVSPEAGAIEFRGRPVRFRHPHEALRLGISMIHQELLLFPELSAAENILMGREPGRGPWIDRARRDAEAAALLGRLGVSIPPGRPVRDLSVAERQMVEIARALAHRAEVLFMDEPTSALSAREAETLFGVIGELRRAGVAVVYVSHKLEEIYRLADVLTVLRDGRVVGTYPPNEVPPDRLIALMVGREPVAAGGRAAAAPGEVVLEVIGLGRRGRFREVSFRVRRGGILGLAGLMGAGRTELLEALFGLVPADAGEIRVRGRSVRIAGPPDALRLGIALVGEDRRRTGLVPPMAVAHNITLAGLRRWCRGPFVDRRAETRAAEEQIRDLGIRARPGQPVATLSGGNQQKVVLARALLTGPEILLLDEPTRGIDVGAKAEIHDLIRRLAGTGKAVILASSELPEVMSLSDRLLVMREGAVCAELDPRRATPEDVMRHAVPA